MKKLLVLALLFTLSFALVGTSFAATYDSLPGGKNYIAQEDVTSTTGYIRITDNITVKANTDYVISFPWVAPMGFYEGSEYTSTLTVLGNSGFIFDDTITDSNYYSVCSEDIGGYLSCTFNTGSNTVLTEIGMSTSGDTSLAWNGSSAMQLEEGTVGTAYEAYIAPVNDTTAPIINGGSGVYITNVNNPHSLATIKSTLSAVDDNDGTVPITVQSDAYTGNENTLGDYLIVFRATDSAGNYNEVNLTVRVVDVEAPIINLIGGSPFYVEVGSVFTDPGATVSDNYDSGMNVTSSGTVNTSVLGTYTRYYNVTDSSGNSATQVTRSVIVRDTTAPAQSLVGSSTVYIEFGDNYSELGATWTDTYDGSGSSVVIGSVNVGVLGTYIISYNITDSNGNVASTITRTVVVRDTTAPVFTGNSNYTWNVSLGYNMFYLQSLFTASDLYDGDLTADITVQSDTFSGNETAIGIYTVVFRATDSIGNYTDFTVTINIIDDIAPLFTTTASILTMEYANSMTQQDIIDYLNNQ